MQVPVPHLLNFASQRGSAGDTTGLLLGALTHFLRMADNGALRPALRRPAKPHMGIKELVFFIFQPAENHMKTMFHFLTSPKMRKNRALKAMRISGAIFFSGLRICFRLYPCSCIPKYGETRLILSFLLMICLVPSQFSYSATQSLSADARLEIVCTGNTVRIHASNVHFENLLKELNQKCGIAFSGMETHFQKVVNFSSENQDMEETLLRLLQYMDINNYFLEFRDNQLAGLFIPDASAFPPSASASSLPEPGRQIRPSVSTPPPQPDPKDSIRAVRVYGLIDDTQAESSGIMEGDVIVNYDGVMIDSTSKLIREVQKREEDDIVEMTVIRDGTPVTISLRGGFIGVRIRTENLPKAELGELLPAENPREEAVPTY